MNFNKMANEILVNVGNVENIKEVIHCYTRLRFTLIDNDKVNKEKLQKIDGVLTVQESMDQLQIVIGSTVDKVYKELVALMENSEVSLDAKNTKSTKEISKEKTNTSKNSIGDLLNKALSTMSKIFAPVVPALAGSGMIKGILAVLSMYYMNKHGVDIKTNDTYIIFNAASDAVFYFFPIILAYTSAKVFKASELISMVLGATLCYPAIVSLMGEDLYIISNTYNNCYLGIIICGEIFK